MTRLSVGQRTAALAIAGALLPPGERLPGAGERTVTAAEAFVEELSPRLPGLLGWLVQTLDRAAIVRTGRRFHRLSADAQQRQIQRWEDNVVTGLPLQALAVLFKLAHYDDPEVYRTLGCVYEKGGPAEPARWLQQVTPGADWDPTDEIECDVVIAGTGAAGAIVGKELAELGYAVVYLEEGEHHRRDSFTGSLKEAHNQLYRGKASIVTLGNSVMPVLMGRLVGGSTAINTGTCFRTPDRILNRWCEQLDTDELSPASMARHFDRVERILRVAPNDAKYIGPIGQIIARGCEQLGWSHFAVPRNAPDCDGQGVCDFGCPTQARRSVDVSYIPTACERGAVVFTGTRACRIRIENGRAIGMEAEVGATGATLRVRARAAVLSCGTVPTPMFLLDQGICNSSGQVGRNLSVHPSSVVSAFFDQQVEGYNHIPQGIGSKQFLDDGIMVLGAQAAVNVGALLLPFTGRRFAAAMDRFDRLASLGALIEDTTQNGRVRVGPKGWPLVTYNMQARDVRRMQDGLTHIMEIFHAAGAEQFHPLVRGMTEVHGARGIEKFRSAQLSARDLRCTSFHPLGTCRMGADPRTSVVDLSHEAHELPGLFVVDGSTVPGPTAVNPQLTIMAMATRAAEGIAHRLDG